MTLKYNESVGSGPFYGGAVAGVVLNVLAVALALRSLRKDWTAVSPRLALKKTTYRTAFVEWALAFLAMLLAGHNVYTTGYQPGLAFLVWVDVLFSLFMVAYVEGRLRDRPFPPDTLLGWSLPYVEISPEKRRLLVLLNAFLWVMMAFIAFVEAATVSCFPLACSHARAAAVVQFFLFAVLLASFFKLLYGLRHRFKSVRCLFLWMEALSAVVPDLLYTQHTCHDLRPLSASETYVVLDWETRDHRSILNSPVTGYALRYRLASENQPGDPSECIVSIWEVVNVDAPPVKICHLQPGQKYEVELPTATTARSAGQLRRQTSNPHVRTVKRFLGTTRILPLTSPQSGREAHSSREPLARVSSNTDIKTLASGDGVECAICCETRGEEEMVALPSCRHGNDAKMCNACWAQTIRDALGDRSKFPVHCPLCKAERNQCYALDSLAVDHIFTRCKYMVRNMQLTDREHERFNRTTKMIRIPEAERIECPRQQCQEIMSRAVQPPAAAGDEANAAEAGGDSRLVVECSFCKFDFCTSCNASPFHHGRTCREYAQGLQEHREKLDQMQQRDLEQEIQRREKRNQRLQAIQSRNGGETRPENYSSGKHALEAELSRMRAQQLSHRQANQLTQNLIDETTKACPECGFRVTHYRGHSCHHIRPAPNYDGTGGGCPQCGFHYCYNCCAKWGTCQCPTFCDDQCTCLPCDTCKPGLPCSQCDADGRCRSCAL